MTNKSKSGLALAIALALATGAGSAMADDKGRGKSDDKGKGGIAACKVLASAIGTSQGGVYAALQGALNTAVASETSGLNLNVWATLVNRGNLHRMLPGCRDWTTAR